MPVVVGILTSDNLHLLTLDDPDVFDGPIHPKWSAGFLADHRHHLNIPVTP